MSEAEAEEYVKLVEGVPLNQKIKITDAYKKAANCYKISGNWQKAGDLHMGIASIETGYGQMMNYVKAAEAYAHINHVLAITAYEKANITGAELGYYSNMAKNMDSVAKMYHSDGNLVAAVEAYEMAYKYYDIDNMKASAASTASSAANLCIEISDYVKAIRLLDSAIQYYKTNSLTVRICDELTAKLTMCKNLTGREAEFDPI